MGTKRVLMILWFWFLNWLIWLDQGLNVLLFGDPDETVSRRAARARDRNETWGCVLCKILDWIDTRHCDKSLQTNVEGYDSVWQMLSRWEKK